MQWRETMHGQLATKASKLNSEGNHSDALCLLEQAIELRPRDPILLVYRGRVLHALARFGEAERSFREALHIDRGLCYAWSELGLLLMDCKRFEEAAECLQESANLKRDFSTYTVLANVQLAFDAHSALMNAQKALELNPNWDEAAEVRDEAKGLIEQNDRP